MNAMTTPAAVLLLPLLFLTSPGARAQEPAKATFDQAGATRQQQLEASIAELDALYEQLAEEKLPLARRVGELEGELREVRGELQKATNELSSSTLDLTNLRSRIKKRRDEASYVSNLLSDYSREFESRLHIAEHARYDKELKAQRLALENQGLPEQQVYEAQAALMMASIDRLEDALGGTRFEGTAVDDSGRVLDGTFAMVGPVALFRSKDGEAVGTADQRLNSLEPTIVGFAHPHDTEAAARMVENGEGEFPIDPTLGNAHKVEAMQETFLEHVGKGGPVMVPIFALAAAALLVALWRWIVLLLQRKPSRKQIQGLLAAVAEQDDEGARQRAAAIRGPAGRMLAIGVEHMREPRELIEEVMYETVLTTRLKVHRLLPFIAICAASAPLLGLLGTVTGIISTFQLLTLYGAGDVGMLSAGISEALITTKFGLIVAIPSLLLHAFLSRKANGVVSQMETVAVAFVNQVSKTPFERARRVSMGGEAPARVSAPDPELLRAEVSGIITELLGPLVEDGRPVPKQRARTS